VGVGKVLASNSKMHLLLQYCVVAFSSMFIYPPVNRASQKLADLKFTRSDLFSFSGPMTVAY